MRKIILLLLFLSFLLLGCVQQAPTVAPTAAATSSPPPAPVPAEVVEAINAVDGLDSAFEELREAG